MSSSSMMIEGPPYLSPNAGVGGLPTPSVDIPILAVLIALYAGAAAGHMATLQINLRKGHKFIINGALFGFCMARILTCSLRMGWSTHHNNISLAIASQIFLNAGILIVYVVNAILAQRILRARQPPVGWHQALRTIFRILYALVFVMITLVISFIVLQFYTLNEGLRQAARDVQLTGITYFFIFTTVPLFILGVAFALPKHPTSETFGKDQSTLGFKAIVVLVSTFLCLINSVFKLGVTWATPRPVSDPAWYDSKAAFYCFYFVIEILVIYWLLLIRIDQRFHVPNGSSKVKTYQTPEQRPSSSEVVHSPQFAHSMTSEEAEKEAEEV